ncbi:MAG: hypothetical protein LBT24_06460, partial [Tannerella sp.]|nr:hypothetical protein [Tannerella sp.]
PQPITGRVLKNKGNLSNIPYIYSGFHGLEMPLSGLPDEYLKTENPILFSGTNTEIKVTQQKLCGTFIAQTTDMENVIFPNAKEIIRCNNILAITTHKESKGWGFAIRIDNPYYPEDVKTQYPSSKTAFGIPRYLYGVATKIKLIAVLGKLANNKIGVKCRVKLD